ncbi:hypothetical protein D3C73_1366640 [compost metagenome]
MGSQRTDEQVVVPGLERWAVIKSHAADAWRLCPNVMRIDHTVDMFALGLRDRHQRVVDAVGGDRPTVVLPRLRDIDLVTAAGAMFVGPELTGPRIEGRPLLITVAG